MNKKLFLFDADETLWHTKNKDYISSKTSKLKFVDPRLILRQIDGQKIYLGKNIVEVFKLLSDTGHLAGIVSDNQKSMVVEALKLFKLWPYIDINSVNVRLWRGYCPKHVMVEEIMKKTHISMNDVYWFDDKDYKKKRIQSGLISSMSHP